MKIFKSKCHVGLHISDRFSFHVVRLAKVVKPTYYSVHGLERTGRVRLRELQVGNLGFVMVTPHGSKYLMSSM